MDIPEKVTEHIHRLVVPFEDIFTTVFFLETLEGAVIFDTATYPEDVDRYILPGLREAGISTEAVRYIVLSHSHRDHAGGLGRLAQLLPGIPVISRNPALSGQFAGVSFRFPEAGETLCGALTVYPVPGHSPDSLALLDKRTGTLVTGDSLQLYGIYGSGQWGANIGMPGEHLEAIEALRKLRPERIVASHDYHPHGHLAEGERVDAYLDACIEALDRIREAVKQNPAAEPEALAENYNGHSGLPVVSARVFRAMKKLVEEESA